MAKPKMTGSAPLHRLLTAFAGLFGALALNFDPITAFCLAALSAVFLSALQKM